MDLNFGLWPEHDEQTYQTTWGRTMLAILLTLITASPLEEGKRALVAGDNQQAVTLSTQAVEASPTAEAYTNRGVAYHRLGKAREALSDYNAAASLDPAYVDVYRNRAALLADAGHPEHALADYNRAIKLQPDATTLAARGALHHGQRRYEDAKADYETALKLDEQNHVALNNLAWLLATCPETEHRDGKAAVEHANRVCRLTDNRVKAYRSTLAAAYAEAGEFTKAISIAEQIGDEHLKRYQAGKPVRDSANE